MTNVISSKRKINQRFIVSDSNRLAYAMAMNALDHPGQETNPLLICGYIGTGKSALLVALEHYVEAFHPDKKVKLVSAEHFKIDFIQSLHNHNQNLLLKDYEDLDILLVDDVQGFIGHDFLQQSFVKILEELCAKGKIVIFTTDRIPENLKELNQEMFQFLVSNQIVALETADENLKKQVLLQKAHDTAHRNIPAAILDTIVDYLAAKEDYDLRKLAGSMQRVILMAELTGEELNMDFVKKIVA